MVFRVEVGLKKEFKDPEGLKLQKRLSTDLRIDSVNSIRVLRTYLIDVQNTTEAQISQFAEEVLTDAVVEQSRTDEELANDYDFDWVIETGFRPGVTDNEGKTAIWSFFTLFKRDKSETGKVFSGRKYLIKGDISKETAHTIATKMLANNLIQRFVVLSKAEWLEGKRIGNEVPVVKNSAEIKIETIDIDVDDEELQKLSSSRVLALNTEEMQTIKDFFTDEKVKEFRKSKGFPEKPTDCEIEVLAQTWSEHCKHKIFAADIEYVDETTNSSEKIHSLYKSYIKKVTNDLKEDKPWIKSVFDDNAGIIELDEDTFFAMKVETHNSPSALDPYGGSLTGIVGVNRDIIGCGMGAKPIFNTDIFCFASPFFQGELPGKNLLHPGRILRGVHRGIVDGGNESGIPVVNGSIFFDNRFIGKPLVFCGTGGFMPKKIKDRPSHLKKAQIGDLIVMTGGRVGADGIHGATFSSEELNENSPVTAVQIGDPITQKKMLDFILEARDNLLFNAITDNGAGGLSSSIGEMAEDTNGARIDLEKIPLKYSGLQPWEIFISEAQERMSLSVPKEKFEDLKKLAEIHEVEISAIGEFTDSGYLEIFYENKPAALLEMDFLHNGLPKYHLEAKWSKTENHDYEIESYDNYNNILLDMISRLNIASKEDWVRQYDHEVQGRSAVKPFVGKDADGPSDSAVIRTSPFKKNAVITAHGIKPTFSDIDAYWMTASVIDEAVRNAVCVGADPEFMCGLDNFCWPDPVYDPEKNPDGKEKLAALVRSNKALYDFCKSYEIPLISGKDSMKNDYGTGKNKISIPPTLLFTLISKTENVDKTISMDFKNSGDAIYLIGTTKDELGGSEYLIYHGYNKEGFVPKVDAETFMKSYKSLHLAIKLGFVESAHDLSDGGLAVAISESAFSGGFGARIELEKVPAEKTALSDDILLFSESNGRILVSVKPENEENFKKVMKDVSCEKIGETTSANILKITGLNQKTILDLSLDEIKKCWKKPMRTLN